MRVLVHFVQGREGDTAYGGIDSGETEDYGIKVTGGSSGDGTALSNNVAVAVSGAQNAETRYFFDVPSGFSNLAISISGGTGDADLYTRFGSAPTTISYDCRPYKTGNTEDCPVASPSMGRYHIMLRGYNSYSGMSLKASRN